VSDVIRDLLEAASKQSGQKAGILAEAASAEGDAALRFFSFNVLLGLQGFVPISDLSLSWPAIVLKKL
jgi:hypothetical protein